MTGRFGRKRLPASQSFCRIRAAEIARGINARALQKEAATRFLRAFRIRAAGFLLSPCRIYLVFSVLLGSGKPDPSVLPAHLSAGDGVRLSFVGLGLYPRGMLRTIVLQVKPEESEKRLDLFIAKRLERFSRNEIQQRIDAGQVACEGRSAKASRRVFSGESIVLTYEVPDIPEDNWQPQAPVILYEDDRMIAVDKTPDIPVHPAGGFGERSTLTALKRFHPNQYFAPSHRLDRETSGVLLFAKDRAADHKLKDAFFHKRCKKEYAALVVGNPTEEEFEMAVRYASCWRRWITRSA